MGTEADRIIGIPAPPAGRVEALDPVLQQVQAEFQWLMEAFDAFRSSLDGLNEMDAGTPEGQAQP